MLFHLTQITFCQRTLLLMYLSLGTVTSFISTSLPILVELITLAVLLRFFNFLLGCSHAHCLPISDFFQLLTLVVFFYGHFPSIKKFWSWSYTCFLWLANKLKGDAPSHRKDFDPSCLVWNSFRDHIRDVRCVDTSNSATAGEFR